MPETTPLIKAALNLRVGAGFDVYVDIVITGNLPAVVSIEFDDRLVTGLRKKSAILMAYSREGICCFDSILAIVFRLMPVADTCYTKTTTDYRRMIRN